MAVLVVVVAAAVVAAEQPPPQQQQQRWDTYAAAMLGQGQIAIVARACNEGELA